MSIDSELADGPIRKLYQEIQMIEHQLATLKTLYTEIIAVISLDQNKDESVGRLREVIQHHIRFAIEHGGMPKLSEYLMDQQAEKGKQ
jgi:hypothetical protein